MELEKAIEKRRSVRDFSENEVPSDIIQLALKAGLKAPSYNHLKQWEFILVDDTAKRLELIAAEGIKNIDIRELEIQFNDSDTELKEMYLDAIPKQKKMILSAPMALIVTYIPKTFIKDSQRAYDLNCLASVWCCIENILLSFADNDIYGVTYIPQNTQAIKNLFDVPDHMEVAAIIPFGYKAEKAKILPQKEIKLSDVMHFNQW